MKSDEHSIQVVAVVSHRNAVGCCYRLSSSAIAITLSGFVCCLFLADCEHFYNIQFSIMTASFFKDVAVMSRAGFQCLSTCEN